MILSAKHNFGFVHIAKCAGSTIRHQLQDYDDFKGRFYGAINHPELGQLNGAHLPLTIVARYYPKEFEALRQVASYTVLREPMDRFTSGVAQNIRGKGLEPGDLTPEDICAKAHDIIDYMTQLDGMPDFRRIVFAQQAGYIMLDEERVVSHAIPMERIGVLFDAMQRHHGLVVMRDTVWNPTVTYRFPLITGPLKRLKDVARAALPVDAYTRLRDLGIGLLTTKGVPKLNETLEGDPRVQDFVASFYAEDVRLHAAALAYYPDSDPAAA